MPSKVIAISCGQRSSFPRADAVWFSDGRTFVSDNDLGQMWKFRIKRTVDRVESAIKRNIYDKNDFIDVFTGHLSGRFVFTHRILDQDEADSVIKDNDLSEIK